MPETVEDVELSGHLIDSLILPKVLDLIIAAGGAYKVKKVAIGQTRKDPSHVLLEVSAATPALLRDVLGKIADHGAVPTIRTDCQTAVADVAGAFPEGFYATTNLRTEVRLAGTWLPVPRIEMDCGLRVDRAGPAVECVAMTDIRAGDEVLVGHAGVRVFPEARLFSGQSFEFMNSAVSTEKPKGVAIRQIADEFEACRVGGEDALVVGGPAIIHTGSGRHLEWLIDQGYVNKLFAGNALAAHDIEQSMYGTSLGVSVNEGRIVDSGHEHHLRAINRVRRAGSIADAVERGLVTSGVMHACVTRGVPFLLAGSIRDDGPLPDVITDTLVAQAKMREAIAGVGFCLMIATTLHSIAVGNLLPASVRVVCVDINPSTVIKLSDRGSFQTIGVVTDVEPFLRTLIHELATRRGVKV